MNRVLCTVLFHVLLAAMAFSQIPRKISYQGVLTTSTGALAQDGTYSLQFSLYDMPTGGTSLYTETHPSVAVERGSFKILLGSVSPLSLPFDRTYYLQMMVLSGGGITSPVTFTRTEFSSVPYALRSDSAQVASKLSYPRSDTVNTSSAGLYFLQQGTGIGALFTGSDTATTNPLIYAGAAGRGPALWAYASSSGPALEGTSSGSGPAIYARSSGTGNAGRFYISSLDNDSAAVLAESPVQHGSALEARVTGSGGVGIESRSYGQDGSAGIFTNEVSSMNPALYSISLAGRGEAVRGVTLGNQGKAALFEVLHSANDSTALMATTVGNGGAARFEVQNAGNSSPVITVRTDGIGAGVEGRSPSSFAIAGYTTSGSGVYGDNGNSNSTGHAGYFNGRVTVTGNLSKGGGSFKIDHPLDPANKYLYHSFVESPDMMNIYNGNATLDGEGKAVITMPEWFEALNMEFRYQLTAIGAPGPNLHIANEIADNRFAIAGGSPGMKVSWQVTGIRHDPYADKNRIPVEENKPRRERGTYLHPAAHGLPESAAAGHD